MIARLDIKYKCQVLLSGPWMMGVWCEGMEGLYCEDVCEVAVYYDVVNSLGVGKSGMIK